MMERMTGKGPPPTPAVNSSRLNELSKKEEKKKKVVVE